MKSIGLLLFVGGFLVTSCDTNGIVEDEAHVAVASSAVNDNDCGCRNVEAVVNVVLNPETLTTEGTIRGGINGTVALTIDPSSISPVSGEIFPPLEPGTIVFMGEADISTKRGDFKLRVGGINEAVPGGVSAQFGKITDGTGVYYGSAGTFFVAAQNDNETGLSAELNLNGRICYSRRACN